MEVHVYSVKAKSPRYDNIKRPKSKDTQLGILKIFAFCLKILHRASGRVQERVLLALRSICLSEYTQKLSVSRKGAVGT